MSYFLCRQDWEERSFSRLFTSAEWDGHLSALSSAADLPFYSSSSSSTSEASESEASDSEDSALAGGGTDDRVTGCYLRGTLSNAPRVSDLIED